MSPENKRERERRKFCIVQNCKLQTAKYGRETVYAEFPAGNKNELRKLWIENLSIYNQQNTSPPAYSFVCGKHFKENCFSGLSLQIGSVDMKSRNHAPTIFPIFRSYTQRQVINNDDKKKKKLKRKRSYRSRSRSTNSTRSVSISKNTNRSENGRFSASNVGTYADVCQRCEIRLTDIMQSGLYSVSLNPANEIDEISDQDNNATEYDANQELSYDVAEYSEVIIDLTMDEEEEDEEEDEEEEICFGGFNEYEVVKSEKMYGALFIMEHP